MNLPWHVGFSNQIADKLRAGTYQPDLVRYDVVNVCDKTGRHVAWAASQEHAQFIVDSVNSTAEKEKLAYQLGHAAAMRSM